MAMYTLEYARKMHSQLCDALMKLSSGAVESYKIGNRELKYIDIKKIREEIDIWERQIEVLEGKRSARGTRQVVFRD